MAQNKQAIKSRIRSTKATMKITKAMQLLANSKLQRQRTMMERNREYAVTLLATLHDIMLKSDQDASPFLKQNGSEKTFTIMFSSDLGLCGGYNVNMFKYVNLNVDKDSPIVAIGSKGYRYLKAHEYNVVMHEFDSDSFNHQDASSIIDEALKMYLKKEIGKIQVVSTKYINSMTFDEACTVLLPIEKISGESMTTKEILFEPSPNEILSELIPTALKSSLYSIWIETKTSEQGSRRVAMENATDNAEELEEKLVLEFNQARQAAITQELTEIVAGADSI